MTITEQIYSVIQRNPGVTLDEIIENCVNKEFAETFLKDLVKKQRVVYIGGYYYTKIKNYKKELHHILKEIEHFEEMYWMATETFIERHEEKRLDVGFGNYHKDNYARWYAIAIKVHELS